MAPRDHSHRHASRRRGPSPLTAVVLHVIGILAGLAAWAYLTWSAISFGGVARTGRTVAWAFTVAAGLGAAVCLLLVFTLAARVLVRLGLISRAAGRRARR